MQKIVMIILDGLGFDKISEHHTPFLYSITKTGIKARIEPLLAFRGIEPTIFSGNYPDKHKIWLDYVYDPFNSPFKWTYNPFLLFFYHLVKNIPNLFFKKLITAPICYTTKFISNLNQFPRTTLIPWNLLRNYNISMNESINEKNSLGQIQTLFDILRNKNLKFNFINFPYIHSDKDTIREFRNIISEKKIYNFNLIRFFDLDDIGHKFGPNSQKFNDIIRRTDGYIKEIFQKFKKIDDDFVFLIISDHGFVEINRILNMLPYFHQINLSLRKEYEIFIDSTLIRFYTKNIQTQTKIKDILTSFKYGHFVTDEEKKMRHIPNTDIYGDLVFLVDSGTLILPNFYQGSKIIKGMHGYVPKNSLLDPLFVLEGNNFSNKKIGHKIEFVDILPTILDILEINPNIYFDGKSILKK